MGPAALNPNKVPPATGYLQFSNKVCINISTNYLI